MKELKILFKKGLGNYIKSSNLYALCTLKNTFLFSSEAANPKSKQVSAIISNRHRTMKVQYV